MNNKLYMEIGGKMQEIQPPNSIEEPIFVNDGITASERDFSAEISFTANQEDLQKFMECMRKECSVVDITNWPAWLIERLLNEYSPITKLVTRNAAHYRCMQMEKGFACVAGDYDTLFGVPLILDRKGRIKAAQVVEIRTEGGDKDDKRRKSI